MLRDLKFFKDGWENFKLNGLIKWLKKKRRQRQGAFSKWHEEYSSRMDGNPTKA
jgi:hypothetical protein